MQSWCWRYDLRAGHTGNGRGERDLNQGKFKLVKNKLLCFTSALNFPFLPHSTTSLHTSAHKPGLVGEVQATSWLVSSRFHI